MLSQPWARWSELTHQIRPPVLSARASHHSGDRHRAKNCRPLVAGERMSGVMVGVNRLGDGDPDPSRRRVNFEHQGPDGANRGAGSGRWVVRAARSLRLSPLIRPVRRPGLRRRRGGCGCRCGARGSRRWTRTRPTGRWTCWWRSTPKPRFRKRCSSPSPTCGKPRVHALYEPRARSAKPLPCLVSSSPSAQLRRGLRSRGHCSTPVRLALSAQPRSPAPGGVAPGDHLLRGQTLDKLPGSLRRRQDVTS